MTSPAIAASAPSIDSKREAITDFLVRLKQARAWVDSHTDEYADLWAKKANLDQNVSRHWLRQAHLSIGPVDAQAASDLQSTADFLFKVKALPAELATAPIIDTSFQQAFNQ